MNQFNSMPPARILVLLLGLALFGAPSVPVAAGATLAPRADISLTPDQLTLAGDVATHANTVGYCTESWLATLPAGGIILGVNHVSCSPTSWHGGMATAQLALPAVYPTTVYTLRLSWPDRDGKGLHSPLRNQTAEIKLDGRSLWTKRMTEVSTFGDYYAAQHDPILTTIVVTQTQSHTLAFSVPAQTAWDLGQIELFAHPAPTTVRGIGYSPFRDCQSATSTLQPTTQNMSDDLFRLANTSNAIRTYSATGASGQVPALARAAGLTTFAGAWLDSVQAADDVETQALITLANSASINGLIVGNEYYLRHRTVSDITYLGQRIAQVRNAVNDKTMPIMSAEIDSLMFLWPNDAATIPTGINPVYRPILDQVDIVLVHIYPYWSGLSITGAADFTVKRYQAMKALINSTYPGKRIIIGEAGWPSGISGNRNAVPSPENQRRYLLEFLSLAGQGGVEYMYFDAFDELWKIEESGRVGQNWGYSYSDRSAKYDFYGLLVRTDLLPILPTLFNRIYLPIISGGRISSRIFAVYTEWPEEPGHFAPTGWMGDRQNISAYACDSSNPHSGEMAFRFAFSNTGPMGWGGIYWQYPDNNWGNDPRGIDLRGASRVTFWARSDMPSAQVQFLVGGIGYSSDYNGNPLCNSPIVPYPDSVCPKVFKWITLTSNWTEYSIDLRSPPTNLSKVIGGFGWVSKQSVVFYLDDIVYAFD